jgi:hypothetical protein
MLNLAAALAFLLVTGAVGIAALASASRRLTALELLAYGPPIGMVLAAVLMLGLAGPIGLLPATIVVSIFSVAGTAAYWPRDRLAGWRERLRPWLSDRIGWVPLAVIGLFVGRLALLWASALTVDGEGLWAGHLYIWSDWTVHLGDTAAFAYGDNFPPTHPRLADAPLAYHYLISLSAAGMVALGVDPITALPVQSFVLSVSLVLGLFAFAIRLTDDRAMATVALVLFMLGGTLGWVLLFGSGDGSWAAFLTTGWDATAQTDANYWWPNPYFALVMSQRASLFGIPIVLLVLTQAIAARREDGWRPWATAGVVAGFLPLAHLGSFAALGLVVPFLVVLIPRRGWVAFLAIWIVVGGLVFFGVQGGEARASSGLRWEPGWLADEDPWPWFWIKNWGLLLPFGAVGLLAKQLLPSRSRAVLLAMLPIFVVANLFILSVVRWDNSKVLLYAFLALTVLAAAAIVGLWRVQRDAVSRVLIGVAVATMVASGVLTNISQLTGMDRTRLATATDLELISWVRETTPTDAMFAVGLEHNDPVPLLTGRRVITTYAPWLRNIGLDSSQAEADLRSIFRLDQGAGALLERYEVDYVVIGDWEERELDADPSAFAERYPIAVSIGEYDVFAISDRAAALIGT